MMKLILIHQTIPKLTLQIGKMIKTESKLSKFYQIIEILTLKLVKSSKRSQNYRNLNETIEKLALWNEIKPNFDKLNEFK